MAFDEMHTAEGEIRQAYNGVAKWLADVSSEQLERRRKFVEHEFAREMETLRAILKEVGPAHHEAVWMVSLMIQQFRTELKWLRKLQRELPHRAPARHPAYAQASPKK